MQFKKALLIFRNVDLLPEKETKGYITQHEYIEIFMVHYKIIKILSTEPKE